MSELDLRRAWAALPAKKRLESLLEQRDARAAVRAIPVPELYHTLREVGLADAGEVVQLASPEQFRGFVDLGAWHKDRLDPTEVLAWLRAAQGSESDDFLAKLHRLDPEVLELVLRRDVVIHDLEENPDVNPAGVTFETPEGKYLLELKVEGVELATLRQVLGDLVAENPFEATRFFEAVRWEVPSELEETAYRFRAARLGDFGFPSLEEAVSLFTRVDLGPAPEAPAGEALARDGAAVDYLSAALNALTPVERENAEDELRGVINAAAVAEVADPGDTAALRHAGEMARDYLNLGLEQLTGGDPARAAEVLRQAPLKRAFQVGFTLTLQLKYRADELTRQQLARAGDVTLMLDDELATVAALRRKRPLRALRVEGAEPVPFRSRRELFEARAAIERAGEQLRILAALFGGTEAAIRAAVLRCAAPGIPLTAEQMFSAAVAWAVLERRLWVAALPAAKLPELGASLFEGTPQAPVLRPGVGDAALVALGSAVKEGQPELRQMVNRVLARMTAELAAPYLREGSLLPTAVTVLPIQPLPT